MPDFHIVQDPNPLTFDDAKKAFSAEMREGLARAAARARIPEDDVFWGLLVALTELSNTGLEAQSTLIKSILDKFVSVRSEDNKKLAAFLSEYQSALAESGNSIAIQAGSFGEKIESLKAEITSSLSREQDARRGEARKFEAQHDELIRKLPNVHRAADIIRDVQVSLFVGCGIVAFLLGILATVSFQHFFHL